MYYLNLQEAKYLFLKWFKYVIVRVLFASHNKNIL